MFTPKSLTTLSIKVFDFKMPISVSREVLEPENTPRSSKTEDSDPDAPPLSLTFSKMVEDTSYSLLANCKYKNAEVRVSIIPRKNNFQ
jgi:hypothetical protein